MFPSLYKITKRCLSQAPKAQILELNGQTINYIKTGEGHHNLLCFPGALGSIWTDFKPQITDLDKTKFTTIAWDPPGYGFSRPPDRNFNVDFYETDADIAYAFITQLGIKKISLLGWSDGGVSSMILAAKYPDVVDILVIWGANSYITEEDMQAYKNIQDLSKWSDKMKAPLIELYTEQGLQKLWNGWCETLTRIYNDKQGDICNKLLSKITCPTLILHGDKDPMIATEHPSFLLKHIKGAKLYRFPTGKHNIHLRFSKEFNETVSSFILNSAKL